LAVYIFDTSKSFKQYNIAPGAAFEPIAGKIIVCDSGALCTPDATKLTYRNLQRPIYPLDPMN